METIRAFIAIPLPESLLAHLGRLQRRLEQEVPPRSVRWVRPENIHLTLQFLGDTPVEKVLRIKAALEVVARYAPPCTFAVGGLGCFPNPRRPRVIWVGVQEPTGRLAALQDAIEEAMAPLGYPPEGRGFTPHLTLGRVQRRASRDDAARIGQVITSTDIGRLGEAPAGRFVLFQSVLRPTGPEYTMLAEFRLGGGG